MRIPNLFNFFGLFGKKAEPTSVKAAAPSSGQAMLALPAPTKSDTPSEPASNEAGPPFLVFLDEMGFYLPSTTAAAHTVLMGSTRPGKSSFGALLEERERQAPKLVAVSGPPGLLSDWSTLVDEGAIETWQTWLPSLEAVKLDEQDEACVQVYLHCPFTCAELYGNLSEKFPDLTIEVSWTST